MCAPTNPHFPLRWPSRRLCCRCASSLVTLIGFPMRERWSSSFNTIRQENLILFWNISPLILESFFPLHSDEKMCMRSIRHWLLIDEVFPASCQRNWLTEGGPGEEGCEVGVPGTGKPCQRTQRGMCVSHYVIFSVPLLLEQTWRIRAEESYWSHLSNTALLFSSR